MMKTRLKKYVQYALILLLGLVLGWFFFHSTTQNKAVQEEHVHDKNTVWTCSMHPQIRKSEPGRCPICGMHLIPLVSSTDVQADTNAIQLTEEAMQLASVETIIVSKGTASKQVRMYGKVEADERLLKSQTSHLNGRIEELRVNFTGETVHKGQILAVIYSPQLITAQQELLEAVKTKDLQPEIYQASKEKLTQWKLTDAQIEEIERSSKVEEDFPIVANTAGVVVAKKVNAGDYVKPGAVLYDIANLSHVWVLFDAYENDLAFLKKGSEISFTIQSAKDKEYKAKLSFIDQVLDPVTRTVKVRVEVNNDDMFLKPGMFATGVLNVNLKAFTDKPVVPSSAVLWTGKRSVVYVKQQDVETPTFILREVELGPKLSDSYVIAKGLKLGEEIVAKGAFSIDAAAQLEGKPSMMGR